MPGGGVWFVLSVWGVGGLCLLLKLWAALYILTLRLVVRLCLL